MQETEHDWLMYLLGPQERENRDFAARLEQETGLECHVIPGDAWLPPKRAEGKQAIVLYNCRGQSYNALMDKLEQNAADNYEDCHLLLFNLDPDLHIEQDALACRLWGILYNDYSFERQVQGIRAVMGGEMWLPRKVLSSYLHELRDSQHPEETSSKKNLLSKREKEVLALIAAGSTNEEISDYLCISNHTVKSHLYRIYRKIDVPNRLQAALWSVKNL
jgi:DNA-binding NarL/FixJ family response regulator